MDHIDLDLPDADGDTIYLRVYANGYISWAWLPEKRDKWSKRYIRHRFAASLFVSGCTPFIDAAFAALKEKADGSH